MPNEISLLHSSTEALALSTSAVHLIEQKERIQSALVRCDPALVLDTSKAFLESVFKTIINDRITLDRCPQKFQALFKELCNCLPINNNKTVASHIYKIASSMVHNLGELRNLYGETGHGRDGYHECPVEIDDATLLVQFVDGLAAYVLKKNKKSCIPEVAPRLHYHDYPEFNDFLDEQYEGYRIPLSSKHQYELSASELLFNNDIESYREALLQYQSEEIEDCIDLEIVTKDLV